MQNILTLLIIVVILVSELTAGIRGIKEENKITSPRNLQGRRLGGVGDGVPVVVSAKKAKRSDSKAERLKKLVSQLDTFHIPKSFKKESWCADHNRDGNAIFAAAIGTNMNEIRTFIETLRNTKYIGDLVVAMDEHTFNAMKSQILKVFTKHDVILYIPKMDCEYEGEKVTKLWEHMTLCKIIDDDIKFIGRYNINLLRNYFYFWWSRMYSDKATIMLSDFRDVLFQSDPFAYKRNLKNSVPQIPAAKQNQMLVFQEGFPNKMIYRCGFNRGWIESCFDINILHKISHNMVSCSGVSIGPRDVILAYTYLMIQLINPKNRYGKLTLASTTNLTIDYLLYSTDAEAEEAENALTLGNKKCISIGTDQGFHNFLVYGGMMEKLVNIKYYPQGEGPVNTIGALANGTMAILKLNLTAWGVIKGKPGEKKFYNWNGDLSPVVHQYDRFISIELPDWSNDIHVFNSLKIGIDVNNLDTYKD